jgi:uncharacterized protein (TIGR00369 family)
MSLEEHYRKLEHMYHHAPVNLEFKPRLHVSDKRAEIEMEVDPRYFHAANALHGAVYFKMLDDASFFAANSIVDDVFVLTAGFQLHFFRPVDKGTLRAVGELEYASSNLFVCKVRLYVKDQEVAYGTGSFMKSRHPLTEEIGYCL